jgi:gamma-glutamylcyclotransferase (GGCT)/AIG2-like uncharacterized protein YtfP
VSDGSFHIFVYGTLRQRGAAAQLLADCQHIGDGEVAGTLYDVDGRFPALLPYGTTPVRGEIWRCPADRLAALDEYEGVANGLFRRIALSVGDVACWVYVAGPALSRQLTPERRISSGEWQRSSREPVWRS